MYNIIKIIMVLCRLPKVFKHLMKTMTSQLVEHESILTTQAKARYLRKHAGKVLKIAKKAQRGQTSALNFLKGRVDTKRAEQKLLLDLIPRIKRQRGPLVFISPVCYKRKGDNAKIVRISIKGNAYSEYQKRQKREAIANGTAPDFIGFSKRTLAQQKQYYEKKIQENPDKAEFFKGLIKKVEFQQWINSKSSKQPPKYALLV